MRAQRRRTRSPVISASAPNNHGQSRRKQFERNADPVEIKPAKQISLDQPAAYAAVSSRINGFLLMGGEFFSRSKTPCKKGYLMIVPMEQGGVVNPCVNMNCGHAILIWNLRSKTLNAK